MSMGVGDSHEVFYDFDFVADLSTARITTKGREGLVTALRR